jgi:sec-independent protein translocase protein TatA
MVTGFLTPVHVAFLVVIIVLLFGAKRLPELGSSVGHGLREFRESLAGKDAPVAQPPAAQPALITPAADQPRRSSPTA